MSEELQQALIEYRAAMAEMPRYGEVYSLVGMPTKRARVYRATNALLVAALLPEPAEPLEAPLDPTIKGDAVPDATDPPPMHSRG